MIGQTISHYRITAKLGAGGMGVVYKAEDTRLERPVAIKILPHQIANQPTMQERFKVEAKAAAALNHPNIATIYAIEEVDMPQGEKETFIVMEYIEGKELKDIITYAGDVETKHFRQPISSEQDSVAGNASPLHDHIPINQIINIAAQIADGLQTAHEKGIIHRDIKPANIMVTARGQVKVMDFGLARIGSDSQLTQAGTTLGTIAYMSPEQARGEGFDRRTDIWSLGIMLYEMISGKLPFRGHYEQAIMYSIMNEEPEPLSSLRPDIPPKLERIVQKALAKNPDFRYQNLGEMLQDLRNMDDEPEKQTSAEVKEPASTPVTAEAAQTGTGPVMQPEVESAAEVPHTAQPEQKISGKASSPLNIKKFIFIGAITLILVIVIAIGIINRQPEASRTAADTKNSQPEMESPQPLTPPVTPEVKPESSQPPGESQNSPIQAEIMSEVKKESMNPEHSELISELSKISDTGRLMQKINDYKQTMRLAVGKKSDFESVEGFYVFVVDKDQVNEVFQFAGNRYHSLRSGEQINDLKEKYSGKTSIWVRDLGR